MADFEVDISTWVRKAKDRAAVAPMAIAQAMATRLKELTPVVTGRLRAGWQVEQKSDTEIVISNNVEYARRINDGFVGADSLGRVFDQKGRHMVEQVIVETPQIAAQVVKDLK